MNAREIIRLARFGLVGLSASATHYVSVIALVEINAVNPLIANIGGFFAAFWVSYFGHRFWTFGDRNNINSGAFLRFFATALFGFGLNEILFYLMLAYTAIPYTVALAIAVITVAISTYLLSRVWAFRSQEIQP
ncbi:GtrA family protein [Undibacterium piscinae]|uniref:GtrA family protein n=1 Tax=Undibacterium piscinae TaxID=2495591 RepID=A0A6M4A0W1_9BURK|nr:GtrA family protein [Undibacterium piscinae]